MNFHARNLSAFLLTLSLSCPLFAQTTFNYQTTKDDIWNQYLKKAQSLSTLKSEYDSRALKYNGKTMRFTLEKHGSAPKDGYSLYIALHGGGAAGSGMNDSQWHDMSTYYNGSVSEGIYIAPRGISDTWKLHSEDDSYPLYDKIIESAILFDHVNPDRVYILGFSAGGDGVYQITPRMPVRFAAANMSAGHHNWITFDNLYNTPFMLQVGEFDSAYKRNRVTAENNLTLNNLQIKYGSGFIHDTNIHLNGSHNSWRDNDASRRLQNVMADPVAWLDGNRTTKSVNSNAIDWLSQYTRKPAPTKIVWDLSVGAPSRGYQTGADVLAKDGDQTTHLAPPSALFYWLDVSVAEKYPDKGKLVIEAIKATNTIQISEINNIDKFRVLLNPELLDLSKPVNVMVADKLVGSIQVKEELATMKRTMLERSDKNEIYDAEITLTLNKATQTWEIV